MIDDSNKKFWNRISKIYTSFQEKRNKELYNTLCQKIKPLLKENQKVLELACGTGQFTEFLSNNSQYLISSDFSEKMVYEAKKRFNMDNVSFEVQDATNLSYEDNSFDIVLIANALHVMPNPDKALKEIKRVLTCDGILIAPTFVYDGKINNFRLFIMDKIGFKTFNKWTSTQYLDFIQTQGFNVISIENIYDKVLFECLLICKS